MGIRRPKMSGRASVALVAIFAAGAALPAQAQTIDGTLMEVGTDRPISLGLVIMMTTQGDSVTSAVTDAQGRFSLSAEEPGEFLLIASAFGFKETRAGVFELGDDGQMDIEFRVGAEAMPIDGILVELQRPSIQHQLIRNGYVRRLQRGLGVFITPYDIENSGAVSTPDLFRGIPGVAVRMVGGGLSSHLGESVQLASALGYCTPTMYVDGQRLTPQVVAAQPLGMLLPLGDIDAVEVYRRPAEVPIEYAGTVRGLTNDPGACGVIVVWTKAR
jgi:hypothetical protein